MWRSRIFRAADTEHSEHHSSTLSKFVWEMEAGVPEWPRALQGSRGGHLPEGERCSATALSQPRHDSCNRSWIEYTLSIRKWVQLASELRWADYCGTGNMSRKSYMWGDGAALFGVLKGPFLVYTVSAKCASLLVICAAISRCRHVVHSLKMRNTQLGFQRLRGN